MRISRQITHDNESPYAGLGWKKVDVEICAADAESRVCLTDIEVPAHWSYAAAETFVRYYIRRAGVPVAVMPVREQGVPEWLWRRVADTAVLASKKEDARTTHETSAKQVFTRLAGMWTYHGFKAGYFDTEDDARAFHDECCALLARQVMAPNSPQWFNAGLHWAYGMMGPAQGHFYVEMETGKLRRSTSAYEFPQLAACFLHSVKDDLVNEGGIMHLFERETRAFKYGSGAGANMSAIRGTGEDLSSGSGALGLMRFMSVGDKAAGAVRAGGLPRRAGKMVVLDIDHPDVLQFIRWKGEEQYKAAALITGARIMRQYLSAVMVAVQGENEARFSPQKNPALKVAILDARKAMIPQSAIERVISYAKQGYTEMHIPVYAAGGDSDIFFTVGAHQTRQAVRLTDRFMEAAEHGEKVSMRKRTDGGVHGHEEAIGVLEDLAHAVWATGEPTIHFTGAIDKAHSCPESGAVRAATPASEYLFLDDTACPLAAINLLTLADAKGQLDLPMFTHVVQICTLMLDISVGVAQYPSREMARLTHETRPIGLGIAGAAAVLARMGVAYGSEEARATIAGICALLTGEAAAVSADLAKELGAFGEFAKNREVLLRQMQQRRAEAASLQSQTLLLEAVRRVWDMALIKTEAYGARNAQLTCVPPTSTIARVMDCETLGLLPLTNAVRFSPQQNGRVRKSLSPHVMYGLRTLGYSEQETQDITKHVCGHATLKDTPAISHDELRARGFTDMELNAVEDVLKDTADIHAAFDPWVVGERFCREQLKMSDSELYDARCTLLTRLGFTPQQIDEANRYACGHGSVAGAPHVNDTYASTAFATRTPAEAQIAMIAAVQPFLTGGVAHTVHLPQEATVDECKELIWQAWRAGLKAVSFYREGCALYGDAVLPVEDAEPEQVIFRQAEVSMPGNSISEIAAQLAQQWMGSRRELPQRRRGYTQKASIAGHTVYLRTGEYEDGSLGEMFLDMPDAARATRELAQQFARAISVALQYGVPLAAFVESFTRNQVSPIGEGEQALEEAHALLDHVFRELASSYMRSTEEPSTHVIPFKAAN